MTIDFSSEFGADYVVDVSKSWPLGEEEFDLIYMSHVVEHFYPRDRDKILNYVHASLKTGGLAFIRVPHFSSLQATGWEHLSMFGMNGAMGLCSG